MGFAPAIRFIVALKLTASVLLNESPKYQQLLGAVLATIGLAMLTIKDLSVHQGDVLILACAVFTALHIVVLAKVNKNHDVALLVFIQVFVVAQLSLLWTLSSGQATISRIP